MKTTCGIIIINNERQILMGHSTGNKFFDIPKGLMEKGEIPIQSAIRECKEETSLTFKEQQLLDLGIFFYNKEKVIHLFLIFVEKNNIVISNLHCQSYFEHFSTKKLLPEVDFFRWIEINPLELDKNCAKSMSKVLKNLFFKGVLDDKKV